VRHESGLQVSRPKPCQATSVSVKEENARYCELLGIDHLIMRCQWPGLPQEQVLSSIRRRGGIFVW
jgi:hypothetical protein